MKTEQQGRNLAVVAQGIYYCIFVDTMDGTQVQYLLVTATCACEELNSVQYSFVTVCNLHGGEVQLLHEGWKLLLQYNVCFATDLAFCASYGDGTSVSRAEPIV